MKVAVTGANGFIGRHVIDRLNSVDVEVVGIVRDLNNPRPTLKNGSWVEWNLEEKDAKSFNEIGRPDVLIHLAWDGLPNYNSLHHFQEQLPSQYALLSKLIFDGLGSLVVTGTCFEYGMQNGCISENAATSPINPYGLAKDVLHDQLKYTRESHPFSFSWIRLFYMYGPGQSPKSLYYQFRKAIDDGESTFRMSGGEQLRDYLHVDEVAKYIVSIALANRDVGVINVCSGTPISIRRLVESWKKEYGSDIELQLGYYDYVDYEPLAFWGDNTYLSSLETNI